MNGAPRRFDPELFQARRDALGTRFGDPLSAVVVTGSTNDDAFAAAKDGAAHGAVFVADEQTRGRGRRGHTWTSPPGENLTFSLLLRPRLAADQVSLLTLVVGLAVRSVCARLTGAALSVKWPNDVVVARRKLAGILVESRLSGRSVDAVVVGVGVNVHMRALPPEIGEIATSLVLLGARSPSRETLLAELLAELEARLGRFESEGLAPFLEELRDHDALRGERLRVGDAAGVGAGIDETGALLVETEGGRVEAVSSGTVERL
ncbi:MAG TPA: biotin--[acetyl-CoA-carboxylase] ligase [Polyangiaceae bacterium]|nr:biotin--[acetyl-CoA-carboxylase] ligase [Polyangiaceae bacterium]